MIKRDGIAIMNARSKNVSIARETLEIIKNKCYTTPSQNSIDISDLLQQAIQGTVLYKEPMPSKDYTACNPLIQITNETTAQAGRRLYDKNVVALNFASARNQGGGFLGGAIAQEEDLCRCSGLYACLKSKPMFYNENIMVDDRYYTDNIIYSPKVPFFRDEENVLLEEPFTLSIISAPAPNMYGMEIDKKRLHTTLHRRALKIMQVAEALGHKNIILGAWGCGAFCNDPKMVAEIFKDVLRQVPTFEHICFAIYDKREGQPIYETFRSVLEKGK